MGEQDDTVSGDTAEALEALSNGLAAGRVDMLQPLFRATDLATPTIVWGPRSADAWHPIIRSAQRAFCTHDGTLRDGDILGSAEFAALSDWSVVLQPLAGGEDFRYLQYGKRVAEVAQLDMTGQVVSDFFAEAPELGRFFLALYRAVGMRFMAVKSMHQDPRRRFFRVWRRMIAPVAGADGALHRIVVVSAPDDDFRAGLDTISDAVLIVAADGTVRALNRSASALFGAPRALMRDVALDALTGLDPDLSRTPEDLVRSGTRRLIHRRLVSGALIVPLEITVSGTLIHDTAYYTVVARETARAMH
jgi:PAS domain-containing protein